MATYDNPRLTSAEAAARIGISRRVLSVLCKNGEISYYDMPSGYQYDIAEIDRYIASRHRKNMPPQTAQTSD
jgi:predicted site-specific integrase-resolvase